MQSDGTTEPVSKMSWWQRAILFVSEQTGFSGVASQLLGAAQAAYESTTLHQAHALDETLHRRTLNSWMVCAERAESDQSWLLDELKKRASAKQTAMTFLDGLSHDELVEALQARLDRVLASIAPYDQSPYLAYRSILDLIEAVEFELAHDRPILRAGAEVVLQSLYAAKNQIIESMNSPEFATGNLSADLQTWLQECQAKDLTDAEHQSWLEFYRPFVPRSVFLQQLDSLRQPAERQIAAIDDEDDHQHIHAQQLIDWLETIQDRAILWPVDTPPSTRAFVFTAFDPSNPEAAFQAFQADLSQALEYYPGSALCPGLLQRIAQHYWHHVTPKQLIESLAGVYDALEKEANAAYTVLPDAVTRHLTDCKHWLQETAQLAGYRNQSRVEPADELETPEEAETLEEPTTVSASWSETLTSAPVTLLKSTGTAAKNLATWAMQNKTEAVLTYLSLFGTAAAAAARLRIPNPTQDRNATASTHWKAHNPNLHPIDPWQAKDEPKPTTSPAPTFLEGEASKARQLATCTAFPTTISTRISDYSTLSGINTEIPIFLGTFDTASQTNVAVSLNSGDSFPDGISWLPKIAPACPSSRPIFTDTGTEAALSGEGLPTSMIVVGGKAHISFGSGLYQYNLATPSSSPTASIEGVRVQWPISLALDPRNSSVLHWLTDNQGYKTISTYGLKELSTFYAGPNFATPTPFLSHDGSVLSLIHTHNETGQYQFINASNPYALTQCGETQASIHNQFVHSIFVDSRITTHTFAYATVYQHGLEILHRPEACSLTSVAVIPLENFFPQDLVQFQTVKKHFLVVATNLQMLVFDISNPLNTYLLTAVNTLGNPLRLGLIRNTELWLANAGPGVEVWDFSHPDNPIKAVSFEVPFASSITFDSLDNNRPYTIKNSGAHIMAGEVDMQILGRLVLEHISPTFREQTYSIKVEADNGVSDLFDLSISNATPEISDLPALLLDPNKAVVRAIQNSEISDHESVADIRTGFATSLALSSTTPHFISLHTSSPFSKKLDTCGTIHMQPLVQNDLIFWICRDSYIFRARISAKGTIENITSSNVMTEGFDNSLALDNRGFLITSAGANGLFVLNSTSLDLVSSVPFPATAGAAIIKNEENYFIIATQLSAGISIYQYNDALNPVAVDHLTSAEMNFHPRYISPGLNNIFHVSFGSITGIEISDSGKIQIKYTYTSSFNNRPIEVRPNLIAVCREVRGLSFIDTSSATAVALSHLQLAGQAFGGSRIDDSTVAIALWTGGLSIIDLTDPYHPVVIQNSPGNHVMGLSVDFSRNLIWAGAEAGNGLLRYSPDMVTNSWNTRGYISYAPASDDIGTYEYCLLAIDDLAAEGMACSTVTVLNRPTIVTPTNGTTLPTLHYNQPYTLYFDNTTAPNGSQPLFNIYDPDTHSHLWENDPNNPIPVILTPQGKLTVQQFDQMHFGAPYTLVFRVFDGYDHTVVSVTLPIDRPSIPTPIIADITASRGERATTVLVNGATRTDGGEIVSTTADIPPLLAGNGVTYKSSGRIVTVQVPAGALIPSLSEFNITNTVSTPGLSPVTTTVQLTVPRGQLTTSNAGYTLRPGSSLPFNLHAQAGDSGTMPISFSLPNLPSNPSWVNTTHANPDDLIPPGTYVMIWTAQSGSGPVEILSTNGTTTFEIVDAPLVALAGNQHVAKVGMRTSIALTNTDLFSDQDDPAVTWTIDGPLFDGILTHQVQRNTTHITYAPADASELGSHRVSIAGQSRASSATSLINLEVLGSLDFALTPSAATASYTEDSPQHLGAFCSVTGPGETSLTFALNDPAAGILSAIDAPIGLVATGSADVLTLTGPTTDLQAYLDAGGPTFNPAADYNRRTAMTIDASDNLGQTVSAQTLSLTGTPVPDAPVAQGQLVPPAVLNVETNTTMTVPATAFVAPSDEPWTLHATGAEALRPSLTQTGASALIRLRPMPGTQNTPYVLTVWASNAGGNASHAVQLSVTDRLPSGTLPTLAGKVGVPLAIDFSGTMVDPDARDKLTYTLQDPRFRSLNATHATVTPTVEMVGEMSIPVKVTSGPATLSQSAPLDIQPSLDFALTPLATSANYTEDTHQQLGQYCSVAGPGETSVAFALNDPAAGALSASDAPGGVVAVESGDVLTLLGSGADLQNYFDAGGPRFTPAADYNRRVVMSVDAYDDLGQSVSARTLSLAGTPVPDAPVAQGQILLPTVLNVETNTTMTVPATAFVAPSDEPWTLHATGAEALRPSLTQTGASALISFRPMPGTQNTPYMFTVWASNAGGNASHAVQLSVTDRLPSGTLPTLVGQVGVPMFVDFSRSLTDPDTGDQLTYTPQDRRFTSLNTTHATGIPTVGMVLETSTLVDVQSGPARLSQSAPLQISSSLNAHSTPAAAAATYTEDMPRSLGDLITVSGPGRTNVTLTLDDPASGRLSLPALPPGISAVESADTVTLSGQAHEIQAYLDAGGPVFAPADDANRPVTLLIDTIDQFGQTTPTIRQAIRGNPVPDKPIPGPVPDPISLSAGATGAWTMLDQMFRTTADESLTFSLDTNGTRALSPVGSMSGPNFIVQFAVDPRAHHQTTPYQLHVFAKTAAGLQAVQTLNITVPDRLAQRAGFPTVFAQVGVLSDTLLNGSYVDQDPADLPQYRTTQPGMQVEQGVLSFTPTADQTGPSSVQIAVQSGPAKIYDVLQLSVSPGLTLSRTPGTTPRYTEDEPTGIGHLYQYDSTTSGTLTIRLANTDAGTLAFQAPPEGLTVTQDNPAQVTLSGPTALIQACLGTSAGTSHIRYQPAQDRNTPTSILFRASNAAGEQTTEEAVLLDGVPTPDPIIAGADLPSGTHLVTDSYTFTIPNTAQLAGGFSWSDGPLAHAITLTNGDPALHSATLSSDGRTIVFTVHHGAQGNDFTYQITASPAGAGSATPASVQYIDRITDRLPVQANGGYRQISEQVGDPVNYDLNGGWIDHDDSPGATTVTYALAADAVLPSGLSFTGTRITGAVTKPGAGSIKLLISATQTDEVSYTFEPSFVLEDTPTDLPITEGEPFALQLGSMTSTHSPANFVINATVTPPSAMSVMRLLNDSLAVSASYEPFSGRLRIVASSDQLPALFSGGILAEPSPDGDTPFTITVRTFDGGAPGEPNYRAEGYGGPVITRIINGDVDPRPDAPRFDTSMADQVGAKGVLYQAGGYPRAVDPDSAQSDITYSVIDEAGNAVPGFEIENGLARWTPPSDGIYRLRLQARDDTDLAGTSNVFEFDVAPEPNLWQRIPPEIRDGIQGLGYTYGALFGALGVMYVLRSAMLHCARKGMRRVPPFHTNTAINKDSDIIAAIHNLRISLLETNPSAPQIRDHRLSLMHALYDQPLPTGGIKRLQLFDTMERALKMLSTNSTQKRTNTAVLRRLLQRIFLLGWCRHRKPVQASISLQQAIALEYSRAILLLAHAIVDVDARMRIPVAAENRRLLLTHIAGAVSGLDTDQENPLHMIIKEDLTSAAQALRTLRDDFRGNVLFNPLAWTNALQTLWHTLPHPLVSYRIRAWRDAMLATRGDEEAALRLVTHPSFWHRWFCGARFAGGSRRQVVSMLQAMTDTSDRAVHAILSGSGHELSAGSLINNGGPLRTCGVFEEAASRATAMATFATAYAAETNDKHATSLSHTTSKHRLFIRNKSLMTSQQNPLHAGKAIAVAEWDRTGNRPTTVRTPSDPRRRATMERAARPQSRVVVGEEGSDSKETPTPPAASPF